MPEDPDGASVQAPRKWFSRGVAGIGGASFLADLGHEVPTSLLPSLLNSNLHAPISALGLIEGISDAAAGIARFGGGALSNDPNRRRSVGRERFTSPGAKRSSRRHRSARGLRARLRVRAGYGQPRSGRRPPLAIGLLAAVGVRCAIGLSVIPGLLAALAIIYAIRNTNIPRKRERQPIRIRLASGQSGPLVCRSWRSGMPAIRVVAAVVSGPPVGGSGSPGSCRSRGPKL